MGGSRIGASKGRVLRLGLPAAGLLTLVFTLLALGGSVEAAGTGDYPPPASGSWFVQNPTTVSNETLVVNGTLYVYYTTLSLDNVTLLINSTSTTTYGIYVYGGSSTLFVNNSVVRTEDPSRRFYWYTYGALRVERSDISRMSTYGIYTYSGNLVLRNNEIHDGSYGGVSAFYASSAATLSVINNTFYGIGYFAMFLQFYSYYGAFAGPHYLAADFVVRDNIIRDNIGGGIYVYRYFYDYLNTASEMRSNLTVENNQFLRNRGPGLYVYNVVWNSQGGPNATVTFTGRLNITGNTFAENAAYQAVFLENAIYSTFSSSCRVDLELDFSNNRVINNSGAGVFIDYINSADHSAAADVTNDGSMLFANNTIQYNQGYGLRIYRYASAVLARNATINGTISILNNTITNNADAGMYVWNYAYSTDAYSSLLDGPVRIENNTVTYNSGYGIYTYNYVQKYQGDQNGTAEIRGPLTVRNNEVAFNLGYNAVQVTRSAASNTGSTAYVGGDIDVSLNRVYNNSGNGIDIDFTSYKFLGKASGLSVIESNLTLEDNWVANNSLYIGVAIDRVSTTYYSSASRLIGWTRIRGNLIEGHDSNGLFVLQRTLNYYGSSGAESLQRGDILVENNIVRRNNQAAAYFYYYTYSYYSTSCRVESNFTVRNNTVTDNQNTGFFGYFYAWADTALSGDTQLKSEVDVRDNDFSRNKGQGFILYRYAVSSRTPSNDAAVVGNVTFASNVAGSNLETGLYLYDYVSNSQGDTGASARIVGAYTATNNTLNYNLGYLGGLVFYAYISAYETQTLSRHSPVTLTGNTVRGNSGYGVYVALTAYQYYFKSATDRGFANDTSDFLVTGNAVDANSRGGLYLVFSIDSEVAATTANPRVEGNSFSGNHGSYALFLGLYDLNGFAVVRDNQISSNDVAGVVAAVTQGGGTGFLFENNTMRQNIASSYGVAVNFGGAAFNLTVDLNTLLQNEVDGGPFFAISNNGRTQIFRNTARAGINTTAVFDIDAPSTSSWITVQNNTMDGNAGKGVTIVTEGLAFIEWNTASNNSADGIAVLTGGDYLSSLARITISNNTADGNGGNGLWGYATNRLVVQDNRARGNGLAGVRVNYLAAAPQVERNNLTGNRYGLLLSGNGTSPLTASYPLRNLVIQGSISAGLYVDDVAVSLYNSTITSPFGVDLSVRQARIDAYGTAVGYGEGEVRGSGSIHVWWNLSFRVLWQSGAPVPSPAIQMNGSTGAEYGQKVGNATGRVAPFLAEEWAMQDASRLLWSPYTFTAFRAGEEGSNTTALDRDKEVWIFIQDRHPPSLSIDRPTDGAIYNRSLVPYAGNASDQGSGLARIDYSVDGSPPFTIGVGPTGSFAGALTLPDGVHQASFHAIDIAGADTWVFINFTVDTTPPRLVRVAPAFNLTNISVVTVVYQTDPDVVTCSILYESLTLRSDATFTTEVRLFEGINLFRIRATDRAGNSNETSLALTLDTLPPTITLDRPEDGFLTNNPIILFAGSTEADAEFRIAGQLKALLPGGAFEEAVPLSEGNNTVELAARDAAGNWGYLRVHGVLDRSPPFLRVTSPAEGSVTPSEFVSVQGDVEEGALLFINGAGVFAIGSFSQSVHLNEGPNTINIAARDGAGNEARVTRTVWKDTTVPFLDILDPAGGHGWTNLPLYTIRGLTEPFANVSGGSFRVAADETGAFALPVELSQEETILRIEAVDRIGNRNQTAVTITLDTEAPALIIYSPEDKTRYQVGSAEIQGATEFGALLTIEGEPVQVAVDGVFRWVVTLRTGVNNITVKAVDKAGNTAQVSLTLYLGGGGSGDAPPPPSTGTTGATTQPAGGDSFLWAAVLAAAAVGAFYLRGRLKRGPSVE
ncbi:MAG TPA: right-handed parallel beta-helix repeat-containing protein [Candidatus Thermoplasmatota archaeon]|nr:right-handed parallel beta-helix repeat-containing protein [Candidatus Thermoplasmatota archaeon]